jgi:hypothetical protein
VPAAVTFALKQEGDGVWVRHSSREVWLNRRPVSTQGDCDQALVVDTTVGLMNSRLVLLSALSSLETAFQEDELAYLSLTSKAEHAVRDRLAFSLHLKLRDQGLSVAREWKDRVDLAILDAGGSPLCIVKLKSFFSFDAKNRTRVPVLGPSLRKDLEKLARVRSDYPTAGIEAFQVLLLAHPFFAPAPSQMFAVRYARRIAQDNVDSVAELEGLAEKQCGDAEHGYWQAGEAFGVPTTAHYWLFGGNESEPSIAATARTRLPRAA